MPISTLGRNINLCFMKIKWPHSPQSPSSQTPDHDHHHDHTLIPTTTSTSTLLIRNFNSLYDHTSDSSSSSLSATVSSSSYVEPDPDDDTTATATAADFASAFASHRFFFSSPGRSNSIVESIIDESNLPSIIAAAHEKPEKVFNNGVPVPKYSPDPYADFRRSMQDMVEARELVDVKSNWEFLHELLLCYLALNPKNTHKFIVGAFADLLVSLMSQQPSEGYRHTDPNLARCYE